MQLAKRSMSSLRIAPEASAAGVVYSPKLSPLGSAEGLFLGDSKSENVPRLAQVVDMITARCPKNELITTVIAFLRAEIRATSCELENSGDGTLVEAWASLKSFKRQDGAPPNRLLKRRASLLIVAWWPKAARY